MAKISLKVLTDIKQSQEQLKALATSVESISKSFSSVKVDKNLTAQINALTKHYNAVAKAAEKVAKVNYNNEIQAQKLAKATAQATKATADATTAIEKSKTQFAKHQKAVNDDTRAQEKHEAQMKKSTEQVKKSAKETEKHGQSIVTMIPNIIKWQVAMTAVMLPLRKLQEGLDSINETLVETEKRVVSLQRVAGQAANANELYDLAQKYGQTFDNVADVVENLVKSGYTWEESLKAAEPALLAINVAELDAAQATEGLIAIVKQYGMELEDLNYIQGVLNKTADNAAVTTEKLLIALQKTGSTAKNANIDFEETVGLITALSEGTAASGQNIGNALRSLIVFTSDNKALETFAGLSSGMAETVKNYRAGQASILDIWQGLGAELHGMNSQKGTLEDLFGGAELTADTEAQLTQITDSFAEIYGTAGNYRQNYFIALLDNIAKVEDATKKLGDVTSYSQKENEKALETYEKKVNSLNAQWQKLANDEQGFLAFKKGMVDLATIGLEGIEKIGGLRTVAIALGGALISILVPAIKLTKVKLTELGITASASLGWISAVATALSVIVGLASAYNQSQHEANQKAEEGHKATVAAWEATKEQAAELQILIDKYKSLDKAAGEYEETEKTLETLLGNKIDKLKDLKKGTEEYKDALIELSIAELERFKDQQESAKLSAKILLQNANVGSGIKLGAYTDYNAYVAGILYDAGVNFRTDRAGYTTYSLDINEDDTVEAAIENYRNLLDAREKLTAWYEQNHDSEFRSDVGSLLGEINAEILRVENLINSYNSANEALEAVIDKIKSINKKSNGTAGNVDKIYTDFSDLVKDVLPDVVKKIKEIRDATKQTYEFEEKKKAVLEAEKALADAQNQRNVRVFSEELGQWVWESNEADVKRAQENLEEARKDAEESAMDEAVDLITSGNSTNEKIYGILEKWSELLGPNKEEFLSNAISVLLEGSGIDISPKTKFSSIVDAPILFSSPIESILRWIPDSESRAAVQAQGILSGTTATTISSPVVNNSQSSHSETNYTVNGVPISSDTAANHTLKEIFDAMFLL